MSAPADLYVRWSRRERALVYGGSKPTAGMLAYLFEQVVANEAPLVRELDERGYDLTTLRLSIRKKVYGPVRRAP